VDTDARPRPDWLRSLVAPLADEGVGAATGYRWYVPAARGGLASTLRAVWNASIASALGADARRNFCWGGSTAVRRETFERLDVPAAWRGALSDDYALTRALRRAGLPIMFAPRCLTASHEDCSWRGLFEFTTRQLKITRVYAPHLWRIVLASNLIFCSVFYGGVAISIARAVRGQSFAPPLAFVALIFALGAMKAHLRLRAVSLVLAREGVRALAPERAAHLALWPLTAALFLWNALAAALSRRLTWRGITYELKSPAETVIIARADETHPDEPHTR
jgi:cellulose synthase/poly-beta-1,6-N-acetylglucosamine synthase-like glycosyltransferase